MANKQISQLTAKPSPVASTDQFGIDDVSSDSWKITVANLQTYFTTLYLTLSGGTMTGALILSTSSPSAALEAASKGYVDSVATGLNIQPSCRVATTGALTATYANGTAGVGATLTNAGAQAAIAIDGVTLALTNRVLVKNQGSTFQNGIYTVTTLGSGASNWVLTRATDYDTAAEITPGDFVLVLSGTVNAQTQWVETATVTTVGTDPIVWDQFGADINAVITGIQNSSYIYSEDTGVANAYLATLTPAPAAYTESLMVILDVANPNTGASTINVNGLGVVNILTPQGGALLAGDMVAGRRAILVYTGAAFQLTNRNIEKRIQNQSFTGYADTGAADAYVITPVPAVTAYAAYQRFDVKITNSNTGASTLDVNGLGVVNIKLQDGTDPLSSDIRAGMIATFVHDGTNFQLITPNIGAGASSGTGDVARVTSPTFVTPTLGVAAATSISFGNEALANYDEGTFVPTLTASGTNPDSVTYTTQVGKYTRIGNVVHYHARVVLSAVTVGAGTGDLQITGLPVASNNTSNLNPLGSCTAIDIDNTGYNQQNAWISPNASVINIVQTSVDNNSNNALVQVGVLTNTSDISLTGFYFV